MRVGDRLTPRQRLILEMILNGYCAKEIATKLGISPYTVKFHTFNLYRALGMRPMEGKPQRQELLRRFGKFRVVWEPDLQPNTKAASA